MFMYSIPWSEIAAHVVVGVAVGYIGFISLMKMFEWWDER